MNPHPYLRRLIAEERGRDMRAAAAAARLAREARRGRRRAAAAARASARLDSPRELLRTIPQPREPQDSPAHRAA
jgi:hypothetical protein